MGEKSIVIKTITKSEFDEIVEERDPSVFVEIAQMYGVEVERLKYIFYTSAKKFHINKCICGRVIDFIYDGLYARSYVQDDVEDAMIDIAFITLGTSNIVLQ